jgi:hypothetical protein
METPTAGQGQGQSKASLRRKRKSLTKSAKQEDSFRGEEEETFVGALDGVATPTPKKRKPSAASSSSSSGNQFDQLDITSILGLVEIDDIDSNSRFEALLGHLVRPLSVAQFFSKFWEQTLYHSTRQDESTHFRGLVTKKKLFKILQDQVNVVGTDIEIDGFEDETDVPFKEIEKQLTAHKNAVKLLCPQKYVDSLWKYLFALEVGFNSRVGCHIHMIPCGSEGFEVDDNDNDGFFAQLEGSSSWELDNNNAESPLHFEFVLNAGDSFYVTQRWKVKCTATPAADADISLLMNIFTNEGSTGTVSELLEMVWNKALAEAPQIGAKALPRSTFALTGVSRSEREDDTARTKLLSKMKATMLNLVDDCMESLDAGVDQVAKSFMMARLPPPLTAEEEAATCAHNPVTAIRPFTCLRIVRPGIARVLVEEGMVIVYHCMDNAREMHGAAIQPLEFELDDGPAIEMLLEAYPAGVLVQDLPHASEELEDKVGVAQALFKEGFMMIVDSVSREDGDDDDNDDPF